VTLRDFIALAILTAVVALASVAGLPESLGAHPWWAARSGVIGSLIGAACVVCLRLIGLKTVPLFWIAAFGLALSAAAAVFGKRAFAASFAESALAGRFWFFGWFGISACVVAVSAAVVLHRLRR
jgi:hypothetical protein